MNLADWLNLERINFLLRNGWQDVTSIDIGQINYSDPNLAVQVAMVVATLVVIKVLLVWFGRNKYFRASSGHLIYSEESIGLFSRFFRTLPYVLLAIPVAFLVTAIADPFITETKEEKIYVETRTRVDIKDISGSMNAVFKNTQSSKAEVAMNAHLEFLKRRAGKGDRASLWIFGSLPHLIQNFIIDDEVYYLQAHDAPWGVGAYEYNDETGEYLGGCYSSIRFPCINGEGGGTVLSSALKAVTNQFDEDEKKQKNSPYYKSNTGRAILVITDAEVADLNNVLDSFEELRKRKIVLYLILINEKSGASPSEQESVVPLLAAVEKNGGKYFSVADEVGFTRAYLEIDNLEKVKIETKVITFKIPLFQDFVFVAFLSLLVIIPLGLLLVSFSHP